MEKALGNIRAVLWQQGLLGTTPPAVEKAVRTGRKTANRASASRTVQRQLELMTPCIQQNRTHHVSSWDISPKVQNTQAGKHHQGGAQVAARKGEAGRASLGEGFTTPNGIHAPAVPEVALVSRRLGLLSLTGK